MALPGERRRGFEGTFEERALRLGDCGSVGDVAQEWRRRIGGAVTVWRRRIGGAVTVWRRRMGGAVTVWRRSSGGVAEEWRRSGGGRGRDYRAPTSQLCWKWGQSECLYVVDEKKERERVLDRATGQRHSPSLSRGDGTLALRSGKQHDPEE